MKENYGHIVGAGKCDHWYHSIYVINIPKDSLSILQTAAQRVCWVDDFI